MFVKIFLLLFLLNIFLVVNHPLFLSLILLLISLTILISIFDSNLMVWFSYLFCMIYLGGIMILFIYISSFLPNKFIKNFSFIWMIFIWMIFIWMIFSKTLSEFQIFYSNSASYFSTIFEMNKLFFIIFSVFYLISVLLITVYYSSFSKMPLREIS